MRFRIVDQAKKEFPVHRLCKVLESLRPARQSGHFDNLRSPGKSPGIPGLWCADLSTETRARFFDHFSALIGPQSPVAFFESPGSEC
jgi:hypothetical protein